MNNPLFYSPVAKRPSVAAKTGVCEKGDRNYEAVSKMARKTFLKTLGFPTPAPENCKFVYVQVMPKIDVEKSESSRRHNEIIAGLGVTELAAIPRGKSFAERCISEKLFDNLKNRFGEKVDRNKCGYIGSLFINKNYKEKDLIFLLLLAELMKTGTAHGLEYGLCIPTKVILKRLDDLQIPYLRLGKIDHINGNGEQFDLSEKYKSGLNRWLNLKPELLLIGKSDVDKRNVKNQLDVFKI